MHLLCLPALNDNYIWLLHDGRRALVVDPGEAAPVQAALAQHGLQLAVILITHHHGDHTAGVGELKAASGAQVFGPAHERQSVAHVDVAVQGGQSVEALGLRWQVIDTPGHTAGHIAFFTPQVALEHAVGGLAGAQDDAQVDTQNGSPNPHPVLFCGDTLFCGGCGRVFEGTPAQMLASLDALAALAGEAPQTLVCCAHEYTLGNLAFAASVQGDNAGLPRSQPLQQTVQRAQALRQQQQPTLPSTLALELQINPFLRSRAPDVRDGLRHAQRAPATPPTAAGQAQDDAAWFAALREWKNQS